MPRGRWVLHSSGGDYGIVNVYNDTSLDMTGGDIIDLSCYNQTSFDMFSGTVLRLDALDSSIINIYDGVIGQHLDTFGMSRVSLYGGLINDYISAGESSEVHIYGTDFVFTPSGSSYFVSGYWENNTPFNIYLRGDTYSRVTTHIIPEPTSILLFGLGVLATRKPK